MHIIVIFDILLFFPIAAIESFKKNCTILFFEEESLLLKCVSDSGLPNLHEVTENIIDMITT